MEPAAAVDDVTRGEKAGGQNFKAIVFVDLIDIEPQRRQLDHILGFAAGTCSSAGAEIYSVWLALPLRQERGDLIEIAGEDGCDPAIAAHIGAGAQLDERFGMLEQRSQPSLRM